MKKLVFLLTVLCFGKCWSQNVFQDTFNSYTVNSQLSGQGTWTNNSSNGGLGACAGAICSNAQVVTPGFSYLNYGNSTNSLQLLADTDGCGTLFTPIGTGVVYIGFMINLTSAVTNPTDFFRVNNGGAFSTAFRMYIKTVSATTFSIGISKGSSTATYTTSSYGFNQDHLIILKYSIASGAADDLLNLYVDPVMANGVPTTPDASTMAGTDPTSALDRIIFRQNTTGTPTGRAGLVSMAQSWTGLIFPNLGISTLTSASFTINSNDAKAGVLSISSNTILDKGTLSIYSIEGKLLERKGISLTQNSNTISIQPIQTSGVYIVTITGNGVQSTQKIFAQN